MGQYKLKEDSDTLIIDLDGKIDEKINLTGIKVDKFKNVIVDFGAVTEINSCGIREWISLMMNIGAEKDVTYKRCPQVVVSQMSTVNGFVGKNVSVESLYLPYYCEMCDKEDAHMVTMQALMSSGNLEVPPHNCMACSKKMEFDEIEKQYFKFIKLCKE